MRPLLLAAALSLALGGCDKSDPRICGSLAMQPPPGYPSKTSSDQLQVAMSCVERWSARLATGPDPAPHVARAAVNACGGAIDHLVQLGREDHIEDDPDFSDRQWWRDHALFIAVQTRAGDCYPDA